MRARGDVDGRADIYSLGAILFELLTARPPFDADNIPALCTLVLSEPPPNLMALRAGMPPALDSVVQRCLCKNPDERFWSVSEFALAIAPFGSHAARASVDRVIRVLGESPPPASQRAYHVSANPAAQTLTTPARSETTTPVASSETVKPDASSRRIWLVLGLALGATLGLVGALIVWRVGQATTQKPLERALARAVVPSVKPALPARVESVVPLTPAPTESASAQPERVVPRPTAREPKPPPSSTTSDSFGGRK